jgi:hypothetical protein
LTSRAEQPIVTAFKAIKANGHEYRELALDEEDQTDVRDDIALFFEQKLELIREQRDLSPNWPGDEKVQALVRMSVPLFVFAATVCRMFDDQQWFPDGTLEEILTHQYGNTELARTYLPVFEQLLRNQTESKQAKLIREYCTVIGTIITLEAPLPATSLSILTGLSNEVVKIKLSSLHSVLSVPDDDEEPVRLFHQSFPDFLTDPSGSAKRPFWVDKKQMHRELKATCMDIMRSNLRKNTELSPRKPDEPDALQYACRYWSHHLVQCEDPAAEFGDVTRFFEEHFLHWMELMGCLRRATEALETIYKLQAVIQVGHV